MKKQRIVAVGGGKGGVGKTLFSINLSLALSKRDQSVLVFDGDLGNANCHTLLGITKVEKSLDEYFKDNIPLNETIVATVYPNLSLICGASNSVNSFINDVDVQKRLKKDILNLDYDYIIIDLGAGIGDETIELYNLAQEKIIVLTPQLTSLQNAYSFVKASYMFGLGAKKNQPNTFSAQIKGLFKKWFPGVSSEEDRSKYEKVIQDQKFMIVVNMVTNDSYGEIVSRFLAVVKDFLGLSAVPLGVLYTASDVATSINKLVPFLESFPNDRVSKEMTRIAQELDRS
ncbi:MAG: P-loop NTPase [Pseudomonadota bacterium]